MASGKKRGIRPTLLVIGEGDCEVAFLKHLRQMFCSDGLGVNVTIGNAHGKGPEHVVDHTRRQSRQYGYTQVAALLDTDIVWTDQLKKLARQNKIHLIGSSPCLEGLLLAILELRVPDASAECKKTLRQHLGFDMTEREHYQTSFHRRAMESARQRIPELDCLLRLFEG